MAPDEYRSDVAEEALVVEAEKRPISTILIIIAMQTEAMPLVNKFQLTEDLDCVFPKGVPWVRYHGTYKDLHVNIIWPGKDPDLGVDSVGTIPASLVTYASVQALQPDLIINAGTAGGFKAKGACIGDVFLVSNVAFHDRRIPIPVFDLYGVSLRQAFSTPNLMKELNLKVGKLSTGDSLDMSPRDEASIITNDATVKDMEVLNEFTHGKQENVSKTEFKEVLSDILLGMAAGLKRDPIVILRIDGEDLQEFINSPIFEPEMVSMFSQIELAADGLSLHDYIIKALEKLSVDQGMPPSTDSWVMSNIVEPALQSCAGQDHEQPISQEKFLVEFKKVAESLAQHLKEQPVIVAHSENTFDGSGIKRLLSNKFEFDKTLDAALKTVPKDRNGKLSKEYMRVALDVVAPSAGLPPYGAIDQMDKVVTGVFEMVNADDGKIVKEDEFKKMLTEILGSIMLQLEGNPISVSSNSVVHEPLASSSTLLPPASS